jgi:hypothetical protein
MPAPALDRREGAPWVWERPERPAGDSVLAVDVNASYLAACSSLRTGLGSFEELEGRAAIHEVLSGHPLAPGYYLVTATAPEGLPDPFGAGPHWLTAPLLELALSRAMPPLRIERAVIWRRGWRPLEPWYRVIRDLRASLMADPSPAARLALGQLKLVYGPLLGGRVASTGWDRTGDPMYRPDWRHAVTAQAKANLYRHVWNLPAEWRGQLFAVFGDALYFMLDHARGQSSDDLPLPLDTRPGHFKILWVKPIHELPKLTRGKVATGLARVKP